MAPLITAYLYHGWMNRPSAIMERWTRRLITTDLVSGAVIAAYIIISFLSLMSFADFLRVEWQQRGLGVVRRAPAPPAVPAPREEDIDEGIWLHVQQEILRTPRGLRHEFVHNREDAMLEELAAARAHGLSGSSEEDEGVGEDVDDDLSLDDMSAEEEDDADENDDEQFRPLLQDLFDNDEEEDAGFSSDEDNAVGDVPDDPPPLENPPEPPMPPQNAAPRVDRQFDFEQDEAVDVDINIALDELLGVRGPLSAVIRNLLWLLAFNAVYIGFFCFVPRTVGTAVSSIVWNTTAAVTDANTTLMANATATGPLTISGIWFAIDAESVKQQTVFRLQDLATVTLGYLAFAAAAWIGRLLWILSQRVGFLPAQGGRTGHAELDEVREAMDEMNRIANGHVMHDVPLVDEPPGVALNMAIGVALDAMMAIVKVGVLLFLKMFLLPILLGVCLDASVASLFGCSLEERIIYAGSDLFSFVLLHWVFGITFMLLVTVSVLQLREVAHPDLLSQIIRPQEPQPDLLGNLMHESVSTHAKRMAVSLVIYAVLWAMHVYIPAKTLASLGLHDYLHFLELKFSYIITPQLQVPFELLFFHLCMLGLLERYKNGLGEMQHHWLKLLTGLMGLRECVLPQKVAHFEYVGSRYVFEDERSIDSFWYDLAKGERNREELLDQQITEFHLPLDDSEPRVKEGVTKPNGERALSFGSDFIRLPELLPGRALRSRKVLLPTKIGKYRLSRSDTSGPGSVIRLWREQPGAPIPRPPEGWDDLGVEPPDVQGRWAYGHEKKSAIEGGVARRRPFYSKEQNWLQSALVTLKLSVLFVLSWIATTVLLSAVLVLPLAVGRFLFFVLRVPDAWIHDPTAFGLGFLLSFPIITITAATVVSSDKSLWRRLGLWISRFRVPSVYKASVLLYTAFLWFGLVPLFLGFAYDMVFIKSSEWFLGEEQFADVKSLAMDWATGTIMIYIWSFLCIRGVLTRRFRVFVLEGRELPEENNPADARAAAWVHAGDGRLRLTWQGDHGRIALFWNVWNAVVLNWEWDKVDPTILLHDVAIPVAVELFWTVCIPLLFILSCWRFSCFSGLTRAVTVRLLFGLVSFAQVARVWRDQFLTWFEAAHKSARDDLYLIGEILMNYES